MPPPKKRVTHRDVARLAGVSNAVVSYVINNGPRPTSPEVRERVLNAIQELDYYPNAFARGLSARRTNTIGFIVNDYYPLTVFVSSYTADILTGLTVHLKAQGYYILVYPMMVGEPLSDVEMLVRSGRLDGVVIRLVQEPSAPNPLLELIAAAQLPCVCIEQPAEARFGFSSVTYDNWRGAYDATSYLIGRGHRRIGHIGGDRRYGAARARHEGYQRALADHGLPLDESLVAGNTWDELAVPASVAGLLALAHPPTAIFAASDRIAVVAIEELRRRQRRVPEDVAVVGFDDIELARLITPPLTTVQIPLYEIGQRAAKLVLEMIRSEEGEMARSEIVPVALVPRSSA